MLEEVGKFMVRFLPSSLCSRVNSPASWLARSEVLWAVGVFSASCATPHVRAPVAMQVTAPPMQESAPAVPANDTAPPNLVEQNNPPRVGTVDEPQEHAEQADRDDNFFRPGALKLAVETDFVGIRVRGSGKEFDDGGSHGTLCGGPADEARRCLADVSRLQRAAEARGALPVYVLTIRDRKPAVWDSAAKLKELLGSIDAPADARLWLFAKTKTWPKCGLPLSACEEAMESGYELRSVDEPRCGPYEKVIVTYAVTSAGGIKLIKRERIKRSRACTIS